MRRSHLRKKYGYFPPSTRFAQDQVPLEIDQCHYSLNLIGERTCYIKGAKKDLSKRLATLQVCVRLEGQQIVTPTIIMRNENPYEDRYELPDGLKRRLVDFNKDGNPKREDEFYDKRVDVMWDPKAWFSKEVCFQWFERFVEQTSDLRKRINKSPAITIQQDNLSTQNMRPIKMLTWENDKYMYKTLQKNVKILLFSSITT